MVERVQGGNDWFILINKSSFEILAGQFQDKTDKIICVKDGTDLLVYNSGVDLPLHLRSQNIRKQALTGVVEYNYRGADDSLYTFFTPKVNEWLIGGRQGQLKLVVGDQRQTILPISSSLTRSIYVPPNPTYNSVPTWGNQTVKQEPQCRPMEVNISSETLTGRIINVVIDQGAQTTVQVMHIKR